MLLGERGSAVHQYEQLDDAADFVEIADGGLQRCQQINGDELCGLLSFRGGQVRAEFAGPRLAVFFGNVPGNEDEVAGTDERNKGGAWRVELGKDDVARFQLFVDGHRNASYAVDKAGKSLRPQKAGLSYSYEGAVIRELKFTAAILPPQRRMPTRSSGAGWERRGRTAGGGAAPPRP